MVRTPLVHRRQSGERLSGRIRSGGKDRAHRRAPEKCGRRENHDGTGPTRSFGPPPEGKILTEPIPLADTTHKGFFENYRRAYFGEEEFLVQIPETRRVLALMDAVRESGRTGESVRFESCF